MGKFRKQNCKSMDEFCTKVNTYLAKQSWVTLTSTGFALVTTPRSTWMMFLVI
jgi:hypothetical protein